jgi:hypothetical protein
MDVPESESEALRFLAEDGYVADFGLEGEAIACPACGKSHPPEKLVVRHTFRFEGYTDPGDEAIVLGLECLECGARGVVVSAYGPDADPQLLAVLDRLVR